jgi:hypothetical protein
MANIITAGNSTNGGTQIVTDTSGTLNIVTGSGSGANAITIDASQNVTFANAISVAGNTTITGTLTATGGVSGGIRSGTAVSASGTSIDFTSLPTGIKRITVILSAVSTNGSSNPIVQLGTSGGIQATSYTGSVWLANTTNTLNSTGFFISPSVASATVLESIITLCLLNSSTGLWVASIVSSQTNSATGIVGSGSKTLSGTLDRVRITTVNGTDTFDAGSINILFE